MAWRLDLENATENFSDFVAQSSAFQHRALSQVSVDRDRRASNSRWLWEHTASAPVYTSTPMNTIAIIRARDGTYVVTLNDDVVAVELTKAAAWRAAEGLVMSDTEDAHQNPTTAQEWPVYFRH
ncbi:hypothetical protein JQ615_19275 [Bradyrhizobium jicamae]|uniref:Uncharacterized protein n=1 Tax=Bradyrhizobium jicamae TaxID=280332 RepID=A0ABS5FL71_9BRAD|nr:hypothetical protein [Bradyrhizobium jicamae]MBR0797534.1 hypothetical protein [Bradyrhizobium jicamae]